MQENLEKTRYADISHEFLLFIYLFTYLSKLDDDMCYWTPVKMRIDITSRYMVYHQEKFSNLKVVTLLKMK